jgi:glutathione synthase/RimK-type ligase-like ATP-grasp enzyme
MSQDIRTQITLPDGSSFRLEDIGAIWYRRPSPIKADQHLPELQQAFIEREARSGLWGMLRALDGACWVNHPGAINEAAYKPYQLALARRLGLLVPRTLLTNNPDEFRRFYEECRGHVIYKLLGFPAYEVEDGAIASTYTSHVPETLLQEAYRIKATTHLFQEFQEKIFDLRVIVIGEKVFAIEIYPLSEETRLDFRLDYRALRYAVHTLPAEIEGALLAMVQAYGLKYAAIDLLYTVERRYLFLELNAVGQLGWLEEPTGLPLFASLAQFLVGVS